MNFKSIGQFVFNKYSFVSITVTKILLNRCPTTITSMSMDRPESIIIDMDVIFRLALQLCCNPPGFKIQNEYFEIKFYILKGSLFILSKNKLNSRIMHA